MSNLKHINDFGETFLPTSQKNFTLQNRKCTSPFSIHLFSLYTWFAAKLYSIETTLFFHTEKKSWRLLILSGEGLISTDSARFDPNCVPARVPHPYQHLSEVFFRPIVDKALKKFTKLTSDHYTHNEILFLTEQSVTFISKTQYGHTSQKNSQTLKLPLLQKITET